MGKKKKCHSCGHKKCRCTVTTKYSVTTCGCGRQGCGGCGFRNGHWVGGGGGCGLPDRGVYGALNNVGWGPVQAFNACNPCGGFNPWRGGGACGSTVITIGSACGTGYGGGYGGFSGYGGLGGCC